MVSSIDSIHSAEECKRSLASEAVAALARVVVAIIPSSLWSVLALLMVGGLGTHGPPSGKSCSVFVSCVCACVAVRELSSGAGACDGPASCCCSCGPRAGRGCPVVVPWVVPLVVPWLSRGVSRGLTHGCPVVVPWVAPRVVP